MPSDLHDLKYACHIVSDVDKMTILDTVVKISNDKSIFLPTSTGAKTLKTVDGIVVKRPEVVRTSPVLDTAVGKCRMKNSRMRVAHDDDSTVRPSAACVIGIDPRNPFLLRARLNVTGFLA